MTVGRVGQANESELKWLDACHATKRILALVANPNNARKNLLVASVSLFRSTEIFIIKRTNSKGIIQMISDV